MLTPRSCFALVAAEGKLWAVGGVDQGGSTLSSVEYYDPRHPSKGWCHGPSLNTARDVHSAVAVAGR